MTLRVDPQVMLDAVASLKKAAGDIDTRLNDLEAKVQREIDQGWIGDARDSYGRSKVNWDRAILEMKQLLDSNSVAVDTANTDFAAADRKNAANLEVY